MDKDLKLDDCQLMFGDCLERMKEIEDNSIDMILCDLPFGTIACKWDNVIPFEPLWKQYKRVIKDNGAIVLFGSQPFTSMLVASNVKNFKHEWIWEKQKAANFMSAKNAPLKYHENIVVFGYGAVKYTPLKYNVLEIDDILKMDRKKIENIFESRDYDRYGKIDRRNTLNDCPNPKNCHYGSLSVKTRNVDDGTRYPKSVIKINKSINGNVHPTQKPVALLEYLIKTYTNEGEMVLDNTMGSGSTGVACVNTNRKFIGIEMEENYFNISCDRIKEAINEKKQQLFK